MEQKRPWRQTRENRRGTLEQISNIYWGEKVLGRNRENKINFVPTRRLWGTLQWIYYYQEWLKRHQYSWFIDRAKRKVQKTQRVPRGVQTPQAVLIDQANCSVDPKSSNRLREKTHHSKGGHLEANQRY